MSRIRTIKPSFFRHEDLQDLEKAHPGAYVMLVFAGLWGHCDRRGTFEWKPRTLKLDILPFLDFDLAATLSILECHGFVIRWEASGKHWGNIPSFPEHQRITGKEAENDSKFPQPPDVSRKDTREALGKKRGNIGETPETHPVVQEGKGREEEKEEEGNIQHACARASPEPDDDHTAMDRIQAVFPKGPHPTNWIAALRSARRIVDDGRATWLFLVDRSERYARFVAAGGVSEPKYIYAGHNFFAPEGGLWAQDWDPPRSKAEVRQDANIAAGLEWLAESEQRA